MNHRICALVPTASGSNLILTSHDAPGASDIPWLQVENEILKEPAGNCFEVIVAAFELLAGLVSVMEDAGLRWPTLTRPNEIEVCDSFSHAGVGLGVGVGLGAGVGATVGIGVGAAVGIGVGAAVGIGVGAAVGIGVGATVGIGVGAAVGIGVGAAVGKGLGVAVGVGLGVGLGVVGGAPLYAAANAVISTLPHPLTWS